jgi:hypothetical protein
VHNLFDEAQHSTALYCTGPLPLPHGWVTRWRVPGTGEGCWPWCKPPMALQTLLLRCFCVVSSPPLEAASPGGRRRQGQPETRCGAKFHDRWPTSIMQGHADALYGPHAVFSIRHTGPVDTSKSCPCTFTAPRPRPQRRFSVVLPAPRKPTVLREHPRRALPLLPSNSTARAVAPGKKKKKINLFTAKCNAPQSRPRRARKGYLNPACITVTR